MLDAVIMRARAGEKERASVDEGTCFRYYRRLSLNATTVAD
jgi:hypothetical protein